MPTYMTAPELASQWGVKLAHLYELASRSIDPLPLRYERGKTRSGFLIIEELNDWIARNTVLYSERKEHV
ncbi:hypothetical protein [Raoultibacter timonensis]|uniref:Helix-turn-helix domain-containing protein n=1 Tax=Raoultibacter timonensis TaxID=1907662 RepID=A0ABM7WFE7_9ACTN|nr:hypothetical protein [Raoultibacter timonensis]BDE94908.1 hypothetical protein CE91St30_02410 [Raoultibacter timonensis]BDF49511.1 hypothetical protein CE91St31_02410 [Raoultibacter timonensis]